MRTTPSNALMYASNLTTQMTHIRDYRLTRDALKLFTLQLLSPVRQIDQCHLDTLTTDDWREMMRMARQHRFAPMLRWRLRHSHAHLHVPAHINQILADELETWTLHNLAVQSELLRVHDILEKSGIPHVALKGAHLAFAVYPQLALRPLRDIDILVPSHQAAVAYSTLVAGGLVPCMHQPLSVLEPRYFPHSLPHLHTRDNNIKIDIHRRLLRPRTASDGSLDPSEHPAFWSSLAAINVQGTRIPVTSAETLLLHLASHAVLEHQFDNGPLVISDAMFISDTQPIDWKALWSQAAQTGTDRALALVLALVHRYGSGLTASTSMPPPDHDYPDEHIVRSAALTAFARNRHSRELRVIERVYRAARSRRVILECWRILFPPSQVLAAYHDVPARSPAVVARYLRRWWDVGRLGARYFVSHITNLDARTYRRQIRDIAGWINSK